ncbi:glyceraldehyde-3-phosphate dehydrogenase [Ignicoccus islandicus DSM 13165]|uniref:Glyceraldehyde-3-phosphate dehydrogenase n=1 Tax=Ignicoccus islandicus DSM 13165 TaxID=940295 RepID=A0A0U3F6L4_9CREN|nr:type II glyceraldehyde-3-phosphate dehydrogenase [Ignicoccus islandicus]ALU11704.1 glyceraldehyde-3-phosphate dehydrogenase [Ignicoccus islandicus DSM 13165]
MTVKVAINGFGTIGKRVAEAVLKQDDMELVGVTKTRPDYLAKAASLRGLLYVPEEKLQDFEKSGIEVAGTLDELLRKVDVVVDATPGGIGKEYKKVYEKYGVKAIFQGGEKHEVAGFSFSTLCNYEEAHGKQYARVVSCNTTGLLRVLCTLHKEIGIEKVRATIVRRGADPHETKRGPINAIVPNPVTLPSHHGIDVRTVLDIDIATTAVVVPTTIMHLHVLNIVLKENVSKEKILEALEAAPRILVIPSEFSGIKDTAKIIEMARDMGRKRYDLNELAVFEESISVNGKELFLMQAVHQESIVVPENIDAIRALATNVSKEESIRKTDSTLGLVKTFDDVLKVISRFE